MISKILAIKIRDEINKQKNVSYDVRDGINGNLKKKNFLWMGFTYPDNPIKEIEIKCAYIRDYKLMGVCALTHKAIEIAKIF